MCLEKAKLVVGLHKPIKCYKLLLLHEDGTITSQFRRDYLWEIGKEHEAHGEEEIIKETDGNYCASYVPHDGGYLLATESTYSVSSGFIHTCKDISCAAEYILSYGFWFLENPLTEENDCLRDWTPIIVECEIPQNAVFYIGTNTDCANKHVEYASKTLKVVRKLDLKEIIEAVECSKFIGCARTIIEDEFMGDFITIG